MNTFQIKKDFLQSELKLNKKLLAFYSTVFLLNFGFLCYFAFELFYNHSLYPALHGFNVGIESFALLLMFCFIIESMAEINNLKTFLLEVDQFLLKDEYLDAIKHLKRAKEYYDDIARSTALRPNIVMPCPENKPLESESPAVEK